MPKLETFFTLETTTKGAVRYQQTNQDSSPKPDGYVRQIYLRKEMFGANPPPKHIRVTIEHD